MKKILILQMRPENETADSEFAAFLRVGHINLDRVKRIRVEKMESFEFNPQEISAIIAGGSPFDISTPQADKSDKQLYVEEFFSKLFDQIIPLDFPFLGACSGNGLLGNYCGVKISRKYAEKVGKTTVSITEKGKNDQLLNGLPSRFTALVGHKEACDELPKNAQLLVTSDYCPIQMFKIKKNIYATQFHPEADEEEFNLRIKTYKDFGYFRTEESNIIRAEIKGVDVSHAQEILKRFIRIYG